MEQLSCGCRFLRGDRHRARPFVHRGDLSCGADPGVRPRRDGEEGAGWTKQASGRGFGGWFWVTHPLLLMLYDTASPGDAQRRSALCLRHGLPPIVAAAEPGDNLAIHTAFGLEGDGLLLCCDLYGGGRHRPPSGPSRLCGPGETDGRDPKLP